MGVEKRAVTDWRQRYLYQEPAAAADDDDDNARAGTLAHIYIYSNVPDV
jgi:hypothetical protein